MQGHEIDIDLSILLLKRMHISKFPKMLMFLTLTCKMFLMELNSMSSCSCHVHTREFKRVTQ